MSHKIKQFQNGANTLTSGLVAYWPLDEASGNRVAFWGEDNLSPTSAPGRAAGKFGYAADFDGTDDYLSVADNIRVSMGDIDFTICAWVNLDVKPAAGQEIAGQRNTTTQIGYDLLWVDTTDRFQFRVSSDGASTGQTVVSADTLGAPSTATWYFVIGWHDSVNNEIGIQVNDLQSNTAAHTGGVFNSTSSFAIGALFASGVADGFLNGKVQHMGVWKRMLTAEERRDLYLGSAAEAFSPDTDSTLTTRLISFWKLDEAAGTRRDFYGGNNLTDNANVTSAAGKVGNAGQFTAASSQYLSIADNASLSVGDHDFTFAGWVYIDSFNGGTILSKWNSDGAGNLEYILDVGGTDSISWNVRNAANTATASVSKTGLTTATWYFVTAWHDATNDQIGLQIDGGTASTAAITGGARDSTNQFRFGAKANNAGYLNARLDEWGFWKKKLSAQEITDLYNSASGNTYPQAGNGQAMEEIDFATDFPDLLPHGGRGIQTFEKIAETSLTADAANIDFTSISGKYRHLMLTSSLRSINAATSDAILVRFNDDTGANYDTVLYEVNDSATLSGVSDDGPGITFLYHTPMPGANGPASAFAPATVWIPDAPNRSRHKSIVITGGSLTGTAAGNIKTGQAAGRWRDTSPITKIRLTASGTSFVSGSRATLYGLRTHKFLVDQDDTLVENLVGYWKLDEASTGAAAVTRVDSWGANHLTDNATVTSNPGRYGTAGQFTALNSEYLNIASNSSLQTGDIDFTFAGWLYLNDLGTIYVGINKENTTAGNREYQMGYEGRGGSDGRFYFSAWNSAGTQKVVYSDILGAPSATTFYHLVGWHDSTTDTLNISVNNGATESVPMGSAAAAVGNANFEIGARAGAFFYNGRIDEVGIWKKVLTAQERSDLYNSGYGNTLVKLGSK